MSRDFYYCTRCWGLVVDDCIGETEDGEQICVKCAKRGECVRWGDDDEFCVVKKED